ncbi:hypothetical protein BC332_15776 [Capsicum chinense]|nr:hypothetical protein BC332_15776 [Capsicum chinense]
MTHVLNVWMYECCSEVDSAIAERVKNVIPQIFNWKVVGIKVKYEKFMGETAAGRSGKRLVVDIQSQSDHDIQGFEDFSTVSPTEILKKTGLFFDASASQHTKRRRTVCFDSATVEEQVYQKTPSSVSTRTVPIQKTPSSDSERAEKTTPSSSSKSIRQDNFDEKWNEIKLFFQSYVDTKFNFLHDLMIKQHQESNEKMDKQHAELIQMLKHNNQINEKDVEGVSADIAPTTLEYLIAVVENLKPDSANVGTSTMQVDYSSMLSESAQVELDGILKGIAAPVDDLPIEVVPPSEAIVNKHDIFDSQLPPDFPDAVVVAHQANIDVIFYYLRKKSKLRNDQDYRFTTTNCFFKNYIVKTYSNYYEDDTDTVITTQQDYAQSVDVVLNEDAITNIIKGYCMASDLPWHQIDEVYVPINYNDKFHWVLAIIALKDRRIRVYDSLFSLRNMESINEINKLAAMMPTYLSDNKFFEETSHTDWTNLEAYRDKITQRTQFMNEYPFEVEYVQDIMQQECDTL